MIVRIDLQNFYSIRNTTVLDFTVESKLRATDDNAKNLISYSDDHFVNIIGLFGGNATGKSNLIKAIGDCRSFVLRSHLYSEGQKLRITPFKFGENAPSTFSIDFVTQGIEYEYSFEIQNNRVISESLYFYPNRRRAKIFTRIEDQYSFGKSIIRRPTEVAANTGPQTLFISRASSMNRPVAQAVYNFFLNEMIVGLDFSSADELPLDRFERYKPVLMQALEVSDSDIVDIELRQGATGKQLLTRHRENPQIVFDFEREESDGTRRLFYLLLLMLEHTAEHAAIFLDEFDLKLHLRLAEFLLDVVRASEGAQLVFTSHNPALIDKDKLLREQIVFVNKQADGNSEFVALSDFEGLSNKTDPQKAYLQGRFNAVPYVGNVYSIIKDYIKDEAAK